MRLAVPHMQKNGGGTIINVSSMSAFLPIPTAPVYAGTKAAVNQMTRSAVPTSCFGQGVLRVQPSIALCWKINCLVSSNQVGAARVRGMRCSARQHRVPQHRVPLLAQAAPSRDVAIAVGNERPLMKQAFNVPLCRSTGQYLGQDSAVRVHAICPSFTDTPLVQGNEEALAPYLAAAGGRLASRQFSFPSCKVPGRDSGVATML